MPNLGVPELLIILVIVAMLFGVGKLPQVFGAVGKGIKEFRKESADVEATVDTLHTAATTLPPTVHAAPVTAGSPAPVVTTSVSVAPPVLADGTVAPPVTIETPK